jgi:DNA-binding CsgD family transcriptional regulator
MWLSYHERPRDMSPRRMSDLIAPRPWRSHPVYAEVFRPLGVLHQITVMVTPVQSASWAGWAFGRLTRDFNDDEALLAGRLQPVLVALNHASRYAFRRRGSDPADAAAIRDESVERTGLTPRELRVLELLATGLTATAIGHACRISPRTVRKHLQNIYPKLGCHDRLTAVRRAAELGLV